MSLNVCTWPCLFFLLLMLQIMKLIGSTKSKKTKDEMVKMCLI